MSNTATITLDISEHAAIIGALKNRVSHLFPLRNDYFGKPDKWMVSEIRSAIKLARLASKSNKIQLSL